MKTPYKGIVKSLRYGLPAYTARKLLQAPKLKSTTMSELLKVGIVGFFFFFDA